MWRKVFSGLSYLLTLLGVMVLVGTAVVYGYGVYEKYQFEQSLAQFKKNIVFQQPIPTVAPTADPTSSTAGTEVVSAEEKHPTPTPIARVPVVSLAPERIVIPSIKVDSPVVESQIVDGEWQVPKFVAGHLEGTANPGVKGNVALSGHVESISSGNVFARLNDIAKGDQIILYTEAQRFMYVVTKVETVRNTDMSVVQPTPQPTVTLITCTGTWLPLARDFDHRIVVVGELTAVDPLQTNLLP